MCSRPSPLGVGAAAAVLSLATATGCAGDREVTFHEDVAPILYEHCATCHRPEGAGPFDLLTYDDLRRNGRLIPIVTASGYMPPWLPEPGHGAFEGARRLTDDEKVTLARWVEGGMVEGDPADAPPTPDWPDGWVLGEPDLVLAMSETYSLAPEGFDIYRNFVIPSGVSGTKWVRAVELRPGNPKVIHHARLLVDRSGVARLADGADRIPGYDGMEPAGARTPEGVLIGWTPGRMPHPGEPGIAWRLDGSTDLVLQLHMLPSGRPERVHATLGLHLADEPPTLHPYALVLGTRDINLPAGTRDVEITDAYVLPVDAQLLAIYPHAHYLGKTMEFTAMAPDGTRRSLLRIDDWDFNWQDEYHYAEPVELERGTELRMRYTYDNTAENPRNPHSPPRHVTYGANTFDEMAELMLQLLPRNLDERAALERDYDTQHKHKAIAYHRRRLEHDPDDVRSLGAIGAAWLALEDPGRAIDPLLRAVELAPDNRRLHNNLGYALGKTGRHVEAIPHLEAALASEPDNPDTRFSLARSLVAVGRVREAEKHLERVVQLVPGSDLARQALADVRRLAAASGP